MAGVVIKLENENYKPHMLDKQGEKNTNSS